MSNKISSRTTLKNTGLVGGSQVISILIGIIKTKIVAILLGPGGIGLIQLFTSTITLVKSISGLGLGFSGVRDVSESIGTGDKERISKTVITLKRWSWVTGLLGVILTIIFSKQLSQWTFGSEDYWIHLSVLSITIIFSNIAASHGAIIRGARRIGDFIKISLWSAFIGAVVSVIIYYFFREKGIVPALISIGLITMVVNIVYSRNVKLVKTKIEFKESFFYGLGMVKLGVFTVLTGFITQLSLYYVRISINDNLGLDSVGYYAVATTLTVTYMGLIFTAMSADYFPKLSAINKDNNAINEAVLEQTKILLLLGTPLIIAMFTFSKYIIGILYTSEFIAALPLLMWMLLSVFLKFIGFPIGYVFLAKGKSKIFIFTQTLWNVIFLILVYFSWKFLDNLAGIGVAFVLAGILGTFVNIFIIKQLTRLTYDRNTIKYIVIFLFFTILYFLVSFNFDGYIVLGLKILGLGALTYYCFKEMEKLIDIDILSLIRSKLLKK